MKIVFFSLVVLCIFCLSSGRGRWVSIGPNERTVHKIFLTSKSVLLAATNEGFYYRVGDEWELINAVKLKINDILELSEGTVVTAAGGGGSNSDGVYIGKYSPTADPPYTFSILTYFDFAETLGAKGDTLYVGGRNAVSMIVQDSSGVTPVVQPLKMPDYAFGVERPFCSSLIHFQVAQGVSGLFAGGYDKSQMMPGKGHLLQQLKDSMVIIKDWNVSAMVKGAFAPVGPMELVAGTRDSGLYSLKSGVTPIEWTPMSSPRDRPVNALASVEGPMQGEQLVIAVDSGVFVGRGGNWTEVGDIAHEPLCLSVSEQFLEAYAGTDKGVYQYSEPTSIDNITYKSNTTQTISHYRVDNNLLKVTLSLPEDGSVGIVLYNLSGKKLCTVFEGLVEKGERDISAPVNTSDNRPLGKGMYLLRVYYNGVCADRSIINIQPSF